MADRWMVLGSSPTAPDHYQTPDVDVIAVAGDGILLVPGPDYYLISEATALWRREAQMKEARKLGTWVVMGKDMSRAIGKYAGKDYKYPCDEIIDGRLRVYDWKPGHYVRTCGGGIALQWAVNHGAGEIHLVGLEGYKGKGEPDYFTGQKGHPNGLKVMEEHYFPMLKAVMTRSPQIQFILYGHPTYRIEADNVTYLHGKEPDRRRGRKRPSYA